MAPMGKASVSDLRYNFPAIERRLRRGEEIEITKRGKPIGRLVGLAAKPKELPDFVARARRILGEKRIDAVELVRYGRGEH